MRFDHVLLENYGPHRRLEFEPAPNMTAIVGPVGAGKTTVLAALEHLLTGKSSTAGVKAADICYLAGAKEPSRLTARLTHGPHALVLTRGLRRATTSLTLDGGAAIEGEDAVNRALADLLGPSYALLGDYAFVKQGKIGRFLEATPAETAAACARLFRVGRAQEIHTAAGKALAKLEVPARSAEIDTLRRELGDDREALEALKVRLAAYDDLKDYDREADPDMLLLAAAEERVRAMTRAVSLDAELTQVTRKIDNKQGMIATTQERVAIEEATEASRASAVATAREARAAWQAHDAWSKATLRLAQQIAETAVCGPEPIKPANYALVTGDAAGRADAVLQSLEEARALVATGDEPAPCRLCGAVPDRRAHQALVRAARASLPELHSQWNMLSTAHAHAAGYECKLQEWRHDRDVKAARRRVLDAERATWGDDPGAPAVAIAEAELLVRTATEHAHHLAREREQLAEWNGDLRGYVREEGRIRDALKAIYAGLPPETSQAERDAARARLQAVTGRLRERGELIGLRKAGKAALAAKEALLARLEAEEAKGIRARTLRGRLEAIRTVCEFTALPREVTRQALQRLEAGLNTLLDRFEAGFRVTVGDDLAFVARFHAGALAGTVQPAQRLSFGQKTVLAWAYWCEINTRFIGEAGQFCLDEPTYGLTGEHFACLEAAVTALRTAASRRGLQCWLVTHEPSLGRLFDTVITLS